MLGYVKIKTQEIERKIKMLKITDISTAIRISPSPSDEQAESIDLTWVEEYLPKTNIPIYCIGEDDISNIWLGNLIDPICAESHSDSENQLIDLINVIVEESPVFKCNGASIIHYDDNTMHVIDVIDNQLMHSPRLKGGGFWLSARKGCEHSRLRWRSYEP